MIEFYGGRCGIVTRAPGQISSSMSGSTVRLAMAAAGTLVAVAAERVDQPKLVPPDARPPAPSARSAARPARPPSPPASQLRSVFTKESVPARRQVVHRHIMAKLQRNRVKRLVDDDEAINPAVSGHDTPAAARRARADRHARGAVVPADEPPHRLPPVAPRSSVVTGLV